METVTEINKDVARKINRDKLLAMLATESPSSVLIAAGWTLSEMIAAGWTLSGMRAAGWTPSEMRAAGWTLSGMRAAGWTLSGMIAAGWTLSGMIAAGWTLSDLEEAEHEWAAIPKIEKPYSRMLADIEAGLRIHDQRDFGPTYDPKRDVCKTPMCTAGQLVNMAGKAGYALRDRYGWINAARMIHMKSRPDAPPQNYGNIPQEWAMAYIRERAAEESDMEVNADAVT